MALCNTAVNFGSPASETPAHTYSVPARQRGVAASVHGGPYIAVFVQIAAGAMVVATGGKPIPSFGLFSVSLPVAEDHDAREIWEQVHEVMWWIIAILVIVHIIAALYKHFVLKNDVLRRMTSGVAESN